MNVADMAWAAGLIDGEGCIQVHKSTVTRKGKVYDSFQFTVRVGMIHRPTIERVQQILGGAVSDQNRPGKNDRHLWVWQTSGQEAMNVVKVLLPYFVTKRHEAEIALKYEPLLGQRRKQVSPEIKAEREAIYQRLRDAKRYEYPAEGVPA